jgi:hypothetical protein
MSPELTAATAFYSSCLTALKEIKDSINTLSQKLLVAPQMDVSSLKDELGVVSSKLADLYEINKQIVRR